MLTILSSQTDCSGETIANTAYTNDGPIFDGSSLCQYYTGNATDVGDIYENIDTAVQGGGACGDADIVAWETSSESGFFTFRYRARTSWNSADIMGDSCSGTSLGVHMDLDADTTAESPQKFDFYFFFSPDVTWQSTGAWRDIAGEGEVTVREDSTASGGTADDWGDATHRISDRGGTAGDGYSSISISAGDVWGRIVDIGGGFEVIEVAVAYSLIGSPSTISSRPWLLQTSTISGDIQPWHDHNDLSDLDGERLDNTCGADPTTCVSTGATPVTLSYFHAESRGREVAFEWATATETGNLGFRLYEETPMGLKLRLGDKLIPSRVIDSDGPQEYSSVAVTNSSTFYLADLDTQGIERRRGPFKLGETYGTRPTADPIDWSAVHRSRGARVARLAAKAREEGAAALVTRGRWRARHLPPVRLGVDTDGIYQVTYEQLKAAGSDLRGVRPDWIAITNMGTPTPRWIATRGRRFGPGSVIQFHGQARDSLYGNTNVYQLTLKRGLVEEVEVESGEPDDDESPVGSYLATIEVDNNRQYGLASPNGDPWYDARLLARGSPVSVDRELIIDGLAAGGGDATLSVGLWGVTNWMVTPDHHVTVSLNGTGLADEEFDGLTSVPIEVKVPAGLLQEGSNTVTVTLPGDTGVEAEVVNLDSVGLTFPRRFIAQDGSPHI